MQKAVFHTEVWSDPRLQHPQTTAGGLDPAQLGSSAKFSGLILKEADYSS